MPAGYEEEGRARRGKHGVQKARMGVEAIRCCSVAKNVRANSQGGAKNTTPG